MARCKFTASGFWRRSIRAAIAYHGLDAREFKGFLSSEFVVTGGDDEMAAFVEWLYAKSQQP
jgi:hypothetical protein